MDRIAVSSTWSWSYILYVSVLFMSIVMILYTLLFYSFDKNIRRENEKLSAKLQEGPLESLLNGSGINNIPDLNIVTTNESLLTAHDCAQNPVFVGDRGGTADDCVRVCANSEAKAIVVRKNDQVIFRSNLLRKGVHCFVGARPECDVRTSIPLMSINSVVCRPKYPNLMGGKLGTSVVACNNRLINDPQNYLWDYKRNAKVDVWRTRIRNENERLADGSFRFRCRYNGVDARGNYYQEHPYNRFHPITNYCADLLYKAHPDVQTVFHADGTFECKCGNFSETRVRNSDPLDRSSQCSNSVARLRNDIKDRKILTIPYKCFTLFSPLEDVGSRLPCTNDKFTRNGIQISTIDIPMTEKETAIIEHPLYKDLSDEGVRVYENLVVP